MSVHAQHPISSSVVTRRCLCDKFFEVVLSLFVDFFGPFPPSLYFLFWAGIPQPIHREMKCIFFATFWSSFFVLACSIDPLFHSSKDQNSREKSQAYLITDEHWCGFQEGGKQRRFFKTFLHEIFLFQLSLHQVFIYEYFMLFVWFFSLTGITLSMWSDLCEMCVFQAWWHRLAKSAHQESWLASFLKMSLNLKKSGIFHSIFRG